MGKHSRIKEVRKELQAEDQRLFDEGQAAGRRMEALGIAPPPECAYPQLQFLFSSIYAVTVAGWIDSLSEIRTADAITDAAQRATRQMARYERHAFKIFGLENDDKPACKAGCNWCCYGRLTIKAHEALLIHHALQKLPHETQTRIQERLQTSAKEIQDAPAEKLVRLTRLCPLNENGRCTVYDARPLVCRTTHSYNVRVCEEFASRGTMLPSKNNGIAVEFARAVALGTTAALNHLGLEERSFDLASIVFALVERPTLESEVAGRDSKALDALYRQDAVDFMQAERARLSESEVPDAS